MPTDYPNDDPLPSVQPELAGITAANAYVTSIPETAKPKVTGTWGDRSPNRIEYYVGKELVGIRTYCRGGGLEEENSFRDGKRHGWRYQWYGDGQGLVSAAPFENGVEHGTALQFGLTGRLIGAYTMDHGTGVDLWFSEDEDGSVYLHEIYYMLSGDRHGYEWTFFDGHLNYERHWKQWLRHGIERQWDLEDTLRHGYPKFWIDDKVVDEETYGRATPADQTLPPYRVEDNRPEREFPPDVARALRVERRL